MARETPESFWTVDSNMIKKLLDEVDEDVDVDALGDYENGELVVRVNDLLNTDNITANLNFGA